MTKEMKKYLWDGAKGEDTLAYRRMCYDSYENVLKDYFREYLKENYSKF